MRNEMRTFSVSWDSPGNLDKGTVIVRAVSLVEALDKFLAYLKKHSAYPHMWKLSFAFTEIDEPEVIE
jgi:hypothetical protein